MCDTCHAADYLPLARDLARSGRDFGAGVAAYIERHGHITPKQAEAIDALAAQCLHRTTCRRCGRALIDPESQRLGIGPECRTR